MQKKIFLPHTYPCIDQWRAWCAKCGGTLEEFWQQFTAHSLPPQDVATILLYSIYLVDIGQNRISINWRQIWHKLGDIINTLSYLWRPFCHTLCTYLVRA